MTKKQRFSLLPEMGCIICGSPACIHHLRVTLEGRPLGMSVRNTYDMTIPLCQIHHVDGDGTPKFKGAIGYHKRPQQFQDKYGTELELLEKTNRKIKKLLDNRI